MTKVEFDFRGLVEATNALQALSDARRETIAIQVLNRAGERAKGVMARKVREALPVKLKYIMARIVWRKATKSGKTGRLRYYGRGQGDSAYIRPRNMRPDYPQVPLRARIIEGRRRYYTTTGRGRKQAYLTYGVGGLLPGAARQSVLRGFVLSRSSDGKWHAPGRAGWDRNRAVFMQRKGQARKPLIAHRGVTIGSAARASGAVQAANEFIGSNVATELARRARVELERMARRPF